MFTFIRNLVGVKTDNVVTAGIEALVRWDPQSATEAELRTMEQHLDELGREVAIARQSYEREQREADAIVSLSQQRLAAADQLQKQAEAAAGDPARQGQLQASLATLVTMLEQMAPDIEREKQDAVDAKSFLDQLEAAYADAGGKLKTARAELDRAQRDMARAAQQKDTAERQAESARRTAGLTSAASGLTVALKAMQDAAAKDLAQADASMAKVRLLKPTTPEKDDPNIVAAMQAVSGAPALPQTLGERLALIKSRSS